LQVADLAVKITQAQVQAVVAQAVIAHRLALLAAEHLLSLQQALIYLLITQ
jgi:hypothetical protein